MRLPEDPVKVCGKQFANTTIQFHECLCQFNYASNQRKLGVLKFKHCALADELRKEINFNMYQIIGFSVLVFFIASIILFLSFKWYQKTKKNPCACLFSCCCSSEKKKAKHVSSAHCNGAGHDVHDSNAGFDENWVHEMNVDVGSFHHHNGLTNGHGPDSYQHRNGKGTRKKTFCMNFCLSEPVQDCCEFFDCDLLWRKKAIYSQPYFGRPKRTDSVQGELNGAYALKGGPPSQFSAAGGSQLHQQEPSTLQRRPTRPAPPPPQLPGAPGSALHNVPVFDDGSHIVDDDIVCEPIPEAPPSPEPVRKTQPDQPRSIYVDPLAFLQRPFLRLSIALSGRDANQRDSKADGGEGEDSEALYSRVKDYVLSRVHRSKSGSVLSLNRGAGGVSNHPDGGGESPSKSKANYRKGGSLASLHNIAEATLGKTFGGSKHSISAASLNMLDDTLHTHLGPSGNVSRYGSRQDLADEDVPPNGRDEYIDLEEMARKMAARAAQQQQQNSQQQGNEFVPDVRSVVTSQPLSVQGLQRTVEHPHDTSSSYPSSQTSPTGSNRTPDFIPASAYAAPQATVHQVGRSTQPAGSAFEIGPSGLYPNQSSQSQTVPTVSNQIFTSNSDSQDATSSSSAFAQANFTSFLRDPTVQQSQQSSVVPTIRDGKPSVPSRPDNVTVPIPSPPVMGSVVPYTGPTHIASSSTSPYVPLSQVLSTPNGTLGRSKPSVPPRPNALNDKPNYKSLGRPSIGPPSPKVIDPRAAHAAALAAASMPHSPMMGAGRPTIVPNMAQSMSPIMLHEQQILQQQLLQQQLYLQQNPHMNPAMQQLILQQQLLHEHTIMTPAVQQQMLQEQQMYQQMLQHQQHYQLQQQYQHHLQQQLLQQQLHHGMRYRQPLSSTSSTASSNSSKSSRSIHKPNHPPPPPPLHVPPPHPSSNSSLGGAPIESSI